MQNKIARIHVNQHVIKANAKSGDRNPVFTIKQGGKNTYATRVKVVGEMELVYSPDKPLSCGAKVWIETRGDITLDNTKMSGYALSRDECNVDNTCNQTLAVNLDKAFSEFLAKKRKRILNKNKLSACLSS
jgi:hypothetical protein